jgi:hypothetical protein
MVAPETYTYTAKQYTFPFTRMRMELDHGKLDGYPIALTFAT